MKKISKKCFFFFCKVLKIWCRVIYSFALGKIWTLSQFSCLNPPNSFLWLPQKISPRAHILKNSKIWQSCLVRLKLIYGQNFQIWFLYPILLRVRSYEHKSLYFLLWKLGEVKIEVWTNFHPEQQKSWFLGFSVGPPMVKKYFFGRIMLFWWS